MIATILGAIAAPAAPWIAAAIAAAGLLGGIFYAGRKSAQASAARQDAQAQRVDADAERRMNAAQTAAPTDDAALKATLRDGKS